MPSTSAVSTTPQPTLASTPTPIPLPTESAAHLQWVKAKTNLPPRVAHGGQRLAVRPGASPRYVAVDAFWEVWTSEDGATWHGTKKPGVVPGPWTTGIVNFNDGLVAFDRFVEYTGTDQGGPYGQLKDGKTWLSTDGFDWASHPSSFAFVRGIADGDRLVATGGVQGEFLPTFGTSTDGVVWNVEPQANEPWRDSATCSWSITSLAGAAAVGFVVAGHLRGNDGTACAAQTARLWRSTDLRSWEPVLESTGVCTRVNDIAYGPRGFVAVGSGPPADGPGTSCAWASRDGIEWTAAVNAPPVVTSGVQQLAIAPDGTFLQYGDEIWESTDGAQWFLSASATNFYVYEIAGDLALGCNRDDSCFALRIQP